MKIKKYASESFTDLKLVLKRVDNISHSALDQIVSHFKPEYFPRQTVIIEGSKARENLYFIHKGLVRLYYKKGPMEVIASFEAEQCFFGNDYSHASDTDQENHFAETLEDTWMLSANLPELKKLMAESHEVEHLARLFLERKYVRLIRHMLEIKSLPAKSRYENFMENNNKISQRIPMKHIANYLGVKGETISRIRSKYV